MLPTNNSFPFSYSAVYTMPEDDEEDSHNVNAPLLGGPLTSSIDSSVDASRNPPTQPRAYQAGWGEWVEWFKRCLPLSKRVERQADDEELQELLSDGRKLRQEAEAISAQRRDQHEFRQQTGRSSDWKRVAGLMLTTAAAAAFGYDRYKAGWWSVGNPDGAPQPSDHEIGMFTDTPLPESAAPISPYSVPFETVFPVGDQLSAKKVMKTLATEAPLEVTALTTASTADGSQIEKIFDFLCGYERNNLSWIDRLRQVGKTLSHPVETVEQVLQSVHNPKQVPVPASHQKNLRLRRVTTELRTALTSMLTLLPGSQWQAWARLIISPTLQSVDLSSAEEGLGQQLLLLAKQIIPTLSQREFALLYSKELAENSEILPPKGGHFANRFIIHDNKFYVWIDGKKYAYQKNRVEISYVIADEHFRIIRFNQKESCWEFVSQKDNLAYTADNRKNRQLYGVPLTQLLVEQEIAISIRLDSSDERLLRITHAGGDGFLGVIMDDTIIPVEKSTVNGETVITAHSQRHQENRVLLHTNYGWVFEPASVEMDKYLKLLLNSKDTAVSYTHDKIFSPIMPAGFSTDAHGDLFIKKDHKYYPVYKFNSGHAVSGHLSTFFIRKDGVFKLQAAHDMLRGYRSVPVGYLPLEPAFSVIRLEAEGWFYLLKNGVKSNALPKIRVKPSLYLDDKEQLIFSDGQNSFAASNYQGPLINLERKNDSPIENQDGIKLWLDEDCYLRIRDKSEQKLSNYSEVSNCRNIQTAESGKACIPILIENSLDSLLTQHIQLGNASKKTDLEQGLSEFQLFDIQIFFVSLNSHKYYFLYKGHYFNARLVEVDDKQNATDQPIIQVLRKCNFFSCKIPIASIVIAKNGLQIEIKQQKTFLAEKLNIEEEVADNYLQGRPYRQASSMDVAEEAVEQLVSSGKMFVDEMHTHYQEETPDITLNKIVYISLFPSRIVGDSDCSIKIFGLNENSDTLSPHIREAQENIKQKIEYIGKFLLPSAIRTVIDSSEQLLMEESEEYLVKILNSDNLEFLFDFSIALKKRLRKIAATLEVANINLVTTIDGTPNNHKCVSIESEQDEGNLSLMTLDKNRKLFINIDKIKMLFARSRGTSDLISLLIHETTRAEEMAADIVHIPRERGQYIPILEAIEDTIAKIYIGDLVDTEEFNQLSRRYLRNVSVYRNKIDEMMPVKKLAYLAKNDPGYLAHLLLNSADFLALLALDLHNSAVYGIAHTKAEAMLAYRKPENILAKDKISTVYDMQNGYIIKEYKGVITEERRSRLKAAMKNASGMNRIYGARSATVITHPREEGTLATSVKMIKVPGVSLSSIFSISDKAQLKIYRTAINKFIMKDPAVELSEKLRISGVNHHEINENNLLFDIDNGFSLIGFDSADIWPEGEPLNNATAMVKTKQLRQLMKRLGQFIDLPPDIVY